MLLTLKMAFYYYSGKRGTEMPLMTLLHGLQLDGTCQQKKSDSSSFRWRILSRW